MAVFLHRSNRMERLVGALADVVSQPLSDPFVPELISVPSPGMERWLSMELCRQLGVWALPAFPFPRKLIGDVFSAMLGPSGAAADAFDPACMTFALAKLLREHAQAPELAEVAHYMTGDRHARKRVALARRIADLFDQYATYRPELVLRWQAGGEAHFQARLFRALVDAHGAGHVAMRARDFLQALERDPHAGSLPERVSVFGISTLPPLYLQVLSAISNRTQVHLFLLSPTREFYSDLRSRRQKSAAAARGKQLGLAWEQGGDDEHPLLASLGRHGRELAEILERHVDYQESAVDLYEEPGDDSLLHALQSDLLALVDRGARGGPPRRRIAPTDRSLSIHACHFPMREVEVLHDQLLALLEDPEIEPHDVVVMTPDIEAYAPLIDAVFSSSSAQRVRIPYRIADRGALRSLQVVNALDAVLDVLGGRLGLSEVLDLLGMEVLRARFSISAEDVETVRALCVQSGVRWGVDAAHRAEVGQPARDENTWRFGLARLFLGYALPDDEPSRSALWLERAPAPIDSEQASLLGRMSELCEVLFTLHEQCRSAHTLLEWRALVTRILHDLLDARAERAEEHKLCLRALQELVRDAERAGFDDAVDLPTLRASLSGAIETRAPARAFLAGGVTFCQLVPMRSIPFRVVCLLGMSDGAFPATDTPLGFDKLLEDPQLGDRSRRNDDRQLFLEALLSARKHLVISYVGQSMRDGKARPPSVLVSELVDHVARGFLVADEDADPGFAEHAQAVEARLLVRHPLAPWSPRYFTADASQPVFSFARGQHVAALALLSEKRTPAPFFAGVEGAATRSAAPSELALIDLEDFLMSPVAWFVRRTLGIQLMKDDELPGDREPLALGTLDRWQVGTELLLRARRGLTTDAWPVLRARGALPIGTPGRLAFEEIRAQAAALLGAAAERTTQVRLGDQRFSLNVDGVVVHGVLTDLWRDAQLRVQYSTVGRRHELRSWLRQLVLSALRAEPAGSHLPARSLLIGRAEKSGVGCVGFGPPDDPRAVLASLVGLYRAGQLAPLPLFEKASRAYVDTLRQGQPRDVALARARSAFEPGYERAFKDGDDPFVAQVYASFDEVVAQREPCTFEAAAERLYGPLLAARVLA
jgi:exodeoxyribonuclease V gamma subunit